MADHGAALTIDEQNLNGVSDSVREKWNPGGHSYGTRVDSAGPHLPILLHGFRTHNMQILRSAAMSSQVTVVVNN